MLFWHRALVQAEQSFDSPHPYSAELTERKMFIVASHSVDFALYIYASGKKDQDATPSTKT